MKKVVNLTKAIGVFALLLLSQALFAQKVSGVVSTTPNTNTPVVTLYVTPEEGLIRVETKLYQLLGTLKQNQDNPGSAAFIEAKMRDEYYRMVLGYVQEGYTVNEAAQAAARKYYKANPNVSLGLLSTMLDEALALLRV